MAGLGLQGAEGLSALQASIRQRIADELARKQQEFQNQIALRSAGRADQQVQQQGELQKATLANLQANQASVAKDREIGLANALAEQIPPGAELSPTDPGVGMLQAGGRGSLLMHQDPTLASTQYTGSSTLPGAGPMTGTLRIASQEAKPERYVKAASAKQLDTNADNQRAAQATEANIAMRTQQLEQAAERLKQQGELNAANIPLAEARAEATRAKAEADAGKKDMAGEYSAEHNRRTLQSVDELMGKVSRWNTGVGSMLSAIPETDARNFKAELDTLKANIGFGELTAMRQASKTGGALGQVSDRELALLTSALGALDSGQSPANIRTQLQKIKDSITRWSAAQGVKPMSSHGTPNPSTTKPTAAELIKKYGG